MDEPRTGTSDASLIEVTNVIRLEKTVAFQRQLLESVVARLALYEIPVDRVRAFLAGVEHDAITGFGVLDQDRVLHQLVVDLLERIERVQHYVVSERYEDAVRP